MRVNKVAFWLFAFSAVGSHAELVSVSAGFRMALVKTTPPFSTCPYRSGEPARIDWVFLTTP